MLVIAGLAGADTHDTGPGHPERPARLHAALAAVQDAGLDEAITAVDGRRATHAELVTTHGAEYLGALERFCGAGGGDLDPDTPVSAGSWDTALQSAGAGLAAIDALRSGGGSAAFVFTRPPGHHALRNRGMGFCLLNNIAIAATILADAGERVAIVDWDVHHGNGTQDLFWDDPRVLYISTHQSAAYPFTGSAFETGGEGAPGSTVNVPLPPGATGDIMLRAMDEVALPAIDRFGPTWLLVSAGYDAHRDDPLAELALTAGDFADVTRRVTGAVRSPGRTVLWLEGGYDLDALRRSVGATLAALCDVDYRPERSSSGGPGEEAVALARRVHERLR